MIGKGIHFYEGISCAKTHFYEGMIGKIVEFVPNLQYFVKFGTNSFGVFK